MERKPYSAGAVKFSFWFMEFRKTVQLLSEGKSFADIKKLNEETNIYHFIIMTGSMAEGTQDRV